MKQTMLALLLLPATALAETPPPSDADKGLGMMQQGAQLLFNYMLGQVEPSLQDMAKTLAEAQPRMLEILAMIDDLSNYHPPERLPNGDIILRRKIPAEKKLDALPGGETEL